MTEKILRTGNISKRYGSLWAVKNVDLELKEGELLGLVGDNGAGKSTLVKMIAGYVTPTEGRIFFKGEEVNLKNPRDAQDLGIETVHQEKGIAELKTISENIFLGRELTKSIGPVSYLDRPRMKSQAEDILGEIGLTVPVDQQIRFCSGGERQGVKIGRAMYFDADVVILDEPLRGLSVKASRKVREFIDQLNEEGISCIYVTHAIHDLYSIVERIVVMRQGEIIADLEKEETSVKEVEDIIAKE